MAGKTGQYAATSPASWLAVTKTRGRIHRRLFSRRRPMRLLTTLTLVTLAFIAAAPAQESRTNPPQKREAQQGTEWQSVITRQIEAFRAADAAGALSCASSDFRNGFKDPNQFYEYIANSDYAPIVKSRSHSFGEFQKD